MLLQPHRCSIDAVRLDVMPVGSERGGDVVGEIIPLRALRQQRRLRRDDRRGLTACSSYSCGAGVRRRSQAYHSCMPAPVVADSCSMRALGLARLTAAAWRLLSKST